MKRKAGRGDSCSALQAVNAKGVPGEARSRRRSTSMMIIATIGAIACRDLQPEVSTAPGPQAPSRSVGAVAVSSGEGSWNSYSAVVTIQQGEASFFGNIGARDMRYRMTRSMRPDGRWAMTIRPLPDAVTDRGQGASTPAFSRIEFSDVGMRVFDASGRQLTRPIPDVRKGTDFQDRARRVRARRPGAFPELPSPPAPGAPTSGASAPSGTAGLDMLVAGPAAGRKARARLARLFVDPPEQRGETLRYARALDGRTLEVTVDSLTGVPVEVRELRAGAVELRVVHTYDVLEGDIRVLRQTRVERSATAPGGARVFLTRYDSVTVGQNVEDIQ
jgi:hypothetical protein